MPFYNVEVTITTFMVVEAVNARDAQDVSRDHWKEAIRDDEPELAMNVVGEVTREKDLRRG